MLDVSAKAFDLWTLVTPRCPVSTSHAIFRLDIITDIHAVGFELICHHEANVRTGPEGLPDVLVITAENDVLRDKGEAYARKLWEAGVRVTCTRYIGTIRDFVMLNAIADTPAARGTIAQANAALISCVQ